MFRSTLAAAALAGATLAHDTGAVAHSHQHVHRELRLPTPTAPLAAVPFQLSDVSLLPGRFQTMMQRNLEYLLNLDDLRLVCLYTSAANLTGTFENPTCNPYAHPQYWGHYLGHFLSASAQMYASTGNTSIRDKGARAVASLGEAQDAWTATGEVGYLFPYFIVSWQNLFSDPPQNCAPVCVPWYVYHKMLAGMLDQYTLAGNTQALSIALGMARWAIGAINGVLVSGGQALWQQVLGIEWGGMNDALYNLYGITGDEQFLTAAHYFNHWVWTAPLAIDVDVLSGNHANTHIPEIVGEARGYELTANATQLAIASNFFSILNGSHSFATGGSNDYEYWGDAQALGDQMNAQTEESCTQYNVLKVSRHLFQWTASPLHADFYERALFNGLIGNQLRDDPYGSSETTGFIYMLPLGGAGVTKAWGASNDGFPCCWGTLSETFSKLGDSIYFASPDPSASVVYVNLFISSAVKLAAQNGVLTQTTDFPYASEGEPTTELLLTLAAPANFTLALRVPYWATSGNNSVAVNGVPVASGAAVAPSTYALLTRVWRDGDLVTATFPATLRLEALNDDRAQWAGVGALMYGGILLAGVTDTQYAAIDAADPSSSIKRVGAAPLAFNMTTPSLCSAENVTITLLPLMDITLEAYTVYWHTTGSPVVGYNASGSSMLPGGAGGFVTSGGAGIVPNGDDSNIRSGNPGEVNLVTYMTAVQDVAAPSGAATGFGLDARPPASGGHYVSGFNFTYQYVSGYGPAGRHVGANFTLVARDVCDDVDVRVLYSSPELTQYPFDVCNTCYSPPVNVYAPPGSFVLNVSRVTQFALRFYDNDRNLQLLLPLDLTLYWT